MKAILLASTAALALTFGMGAVADPADGVWDSDKVAQIAKNRCTNAGIGNDKEETKATGECRKNIDKPENPDDQSKPDEDPGNSVKNANNRK
jgi:hypothetical protein